MRARARMIEVRALLHIAQREWALMRGPGTADAARDLATDAYVRAVDQIIEHLAALERDGLLEAAARHFELADRITGGVHFNLSKRGTGS